MTLVIPARNEARRISQCLMGAAAQGPEVDSIIVVDDQSTDGTAETARSVTADPRLRVVAAKPPPAGWVGKAWALEQGLENTTTEWALCLDADTRPAPGLVAAALEAVGQDGSVALAIMPKIKTSTRSLRCLHPALLTTLIYRLGPADIAAAKKRGNKRLLFNGQCFLIKAETIRRLGGFFPVRGAFAEDVALAQHLVNAGLKISVRSGGELLEAKMYESAREAWSGWGVSLALNENTSVTRQIFDVITLFLVQAAPLPIFVLFLTCSPATAWSVALLSLNFLLIGMRIGLLFAMRTAYKPATDMYWLSPLADVLAVGRIVISAINPPKLWRGRSYERTRTLRSRCNPGSKNAGAII